MIIEQFFDKGLAHASYAIISSGKMAIIDPARDAEIYYDFAAKHNARIESVIETHPHADFVSSHAEIAERTGAIIYVSRLVGADYPHQPFDEGAVIQLGEISLQAVNTPGHSPDSISVLLKDSSGKIHSVFTGDTLFIGDVGRPDLRENAGNIQAKREELASLMYHSTREKLMILPDETLVYPAHGAGSLCGKNLSSDLVSTIGREKRENYALQDMDKEKFVSLLLEDQPFIPKYFGYDVAINKKGAESLQKTLSVVPRPDRNAPLDPGILVVDTRNQLKFRAGHVKGALNIMDGGKFETWLGSVVGPDEPFYLIADDEQSLESVIKKSSKIGYEVNIRGALLNPDSALEKAPETVPADFRSNPERYTIVDVRNESEVKAGKIFPSALPVPLPELREKLQEIPRDKPVVVHCAGGYRSAAGASIIQADGRSTPVYDLGEEITTYSKN